MANVLTSESVILPPLTALRVCKGIVKVGGLEFTLVYSPHTGNHYLVEAQTFVVIGKPLNYGNDLNFRTQIFENLVATGKINA